MQQSTYTDHGPASEMILGEVASPGLVRGRALLCACATQAAPPHRQISDSETQSEIDRFDEAIVAVERKLREAQVAVRRALGESEGEIFEAQILMLRDSKLRQTVRDLCAAKRINVEAALEEAMQELITAFEQLDNLYLRERAADLREVGRRLIDYLVCRLHLDVPADSEGCVLVTTELFASAVAQLQARGVRGVIVERGGLTAHATILVRALGIPMLVKVPEAVTRISAGDQVVVDAMAGRVFVNPKPDVQRTYDHLEGDLRAHREALQGLVELPAITGDGVSVKLSANIGQTADAVNAAQLRADGAGLYRTEFVFLAQDHFPTEAEQYHFYRATAEQMQPSQTVIRLLDVGSDKPLSYLPLPHEPNPALGRRGIRLLLAHPGILRAQLRAILRLSATHPVSILLPMIRGVDEVRATKAAIESVESELAAAGEAFEPNIPLGAMIETPSAAALVAQLANEVDFLSVGTNDLVQYMLVADRTSGETDSAYEPLHPAVLQTLATLAAVAEAKGKPICLCGEIASDPICTPLLLGLGFRSFSVSPGRLLEIKHAIRSTDLAEARQFAERMLSLVSSEEIKAEVRNYSAGAGPSRPR